MATAPPQKYASNPTFIRSPLRKYGANPAFIHSPPQKYASNPAFTRSPPRKYRWEQAYEGKAMAETVMVTYHEKKSCAGNAQSATQRRDEVLKTLDRWVSDYKKIARVALQDDPQLLEALGIAVPSRV